MRIEPVREPVFDLVKALMMIWVFWGHLALYKVVSDSGFGEPYLQNAKIAVNMPVFFVISGCLAARTFAQASGGKLMARIIGFLWPQIAYAFVFSAVSWLLGGGFRQNFDTITGFWFLKTMALVYALAAIVYRLGRQDRYRWPALALLYCFMVRRPALFGLAVHMFPYFVFGMMVLSRRKVFRNTLVSVLCGLFFLVVVVLEGNALSNGMSFWNGPVHWKQVCFNLHAFVVFVGRTVVGLAGSVFVLWLVDCAVRVLPMISRLAVFGTTTLGVYVFHEIVLLHGGKLPFFPLPSWSRWLVAIGLFGLFHCLVMIIRRPDLPRTLFFGNERLLTRHLDALLTSVGEKVRARVRVSGKRGKMI